MSILDCLIVAFLLFLPIILHLIFVVRVEAKEERVNKGVEK
ncbi:hypothetical protein Phab24_id079 [Acinetobacter phage Phab24]|nr:hypothetical protein Phab24_id079 [Acinetobacter phage Phab24]